MRCLVVGVIIDIYCLYGIFMSQLFYVIFKWDRDDLILFKVVKCLEMVNNKIFELIEQDVIDRLLRKEMVFYCCWIIRGVEEIIFMIQMFFEMFDGECS